MPILILLLAVALWIALGFGLARWSGWSILAPHYRGTVAGHGLRWHFTSARLGPVGYRRCLGLAADAHGLRLCTWLPMRLSHPSLFIPWSEVDEVGPGRAHFRSPVRLQLRRAPGISVELPRRLAIAALRQVQGRALPPGAHALLADDSGRAAVPPQRLQST